LRLARSLYTVSFAHAHYEILGITYMISTVAIYALCFTSHPNVVLSTAVKAICD
jgi:hypothetical protein